MVDLTKMTWADRNALGQMFIKYAWSLLGLPYRWGGDDPMEGFDCSGLVIECLKGVGLYPRKKDETANDLFNRYSKDVHTRHTVPCLLFWFRDGRAKHVAIYVGNGCFIEAGGGGESTISEEMASIQNAFVRLNNISSRSYGECVDIFNLRSNE